MKLVVGLGNPGDKYVGTRHNVGFEVIDRLLQDHQLSLNETKFRADYVIWHYQGEKVILTQPYTYMNLSGEAVLPLMTYYDIHFEDLLVIYDDLDMEVGKIRMRPKGSAGGHNGMKSLIQMLGTQEFQRIKLGIGRPAPGWKVVDHVLAPFTAEQRPLMEEAVAQVAGIVEEWIAGADFITLMNRYN